MLYLGTRSLFKDVRLIAYASVMACSAVVLGLAANFSQIFLPYIHRDFLIFALVIPSVTIVVMTVILLRSQPRWDVLILFILAACWLAMGSWSADIIAHVECDALAGQRTLTKNGTMSSQVYCREMKAILAFSWTNFVILVLSFSILIGLIIRVLSYGRYYVWMESISDVPWFNQWNQPQLGYGQAYPMGQYPYMMGQPIQTGLNQYVVHQAPGHSVSIGNPMIPGGAPTIIQTPMR